MMSVWSSKMETSFSAAGTDSPSRTPTPGLSQDRVGTFQEMCELDAESSSRRGLKFVPGAPPWCRTFTLCCAQPETSSVTRIKSR